MPRRSSSFQKSAYQWFTKNASRFKIQPILRMRKGGRLDVKFHNHPKWMHIDIYPENLFVWVGWQGRWWDGLLDLDMRPQRTKGGIRCKFCDDENKIWPDTSALWVDHLFEPFLMWVNQNYAQAIALVLCEGPESSTSAFLQLAGNAESSSGCTTLDLR